MAESARAARQPLYRNLYVLVLVGILLTDLSYALVDPRIRYE